MATYCMEDGRQYTLFAECAMRGWLAAVLDFPRFKSRDECALPANQCAAVLRGDVCCITDDVAYQTLVVSAWMDSYVAVRQASEKEIVVMASVLKSLPPDEALDVLRQGIKAVECRAGIDAFYSRYLAARARTVSE